jgi:hypothetical protein
MLSDIKPDLENITHRHTAFPDNSTKNALAVTWNAQIEVRFFFPAADRQHLWMTPLRTDQPHAAV